MHIDLTTFFISLIISIITSSAIFYLFLSKKEQIKLKIKSITQDAKRAETLMKYFNDILLIKEKNNETRELIDNFDEFLCELCILIDNNLINKSCLRYRYLPLIKKLIETKLINKIAEREYGEFKKYWYQYLYDIYNTRCCWFGKRIYYKIIIYFRVIVFGM